MQYLLMILSFNPTNKHNPGRLLGGSQLTLSFVTDGSDGLSAALSSSRVRLGALSAARQISAMAGPAVAADGLETADIC